jgi:4-hydroxybenzoate polyprenyltransferase
MTRVTSENRSIRRATGTRLTEDLLTSGWMERGARLIRLFPMGVTVLYPIVGLATTTREASVGDWLRLAAVGVLFHVYAYVANDVIDLPIDLTDPRRGRDPMVLGRVSPQWGLWIALAALPLIALLMIDQPIRVAAALAAAVALIGFYDVTGKTIPVPFLADFAQGAGWAALIFVGAGVGGRATGATWWAAGFVVVLVAMVNGVHGAVRDVENDRRAGARTTAVVLDAHIREGGMLLPSAIVAYAAVLQAAIGATLAGILFASRSQVSDGTWRVAFVLTTVVFLASVWQLVSAFRHRTDLRSAMAAGTWHLVLAPLALATATVWTLGLPLGVATAVVFVAPPLVYGRLLRDIGSQLPSTTIRQYVTRNRDRAARRSGLWTMTRIGVPMTSAMLVLVGARLTGNVIPLVIAAMVATALAVAASNMFNDRCDVMADRINGRQRPLVTGAVTENEADRWVLGLSCVAFGSAAFLGAGSMAVLGAMLTVGLAYSLFLRRVAGLGQASISLLFTVPILYGGLAAGGIQREHWLAAALVTVFVFARETIKGCPDQAGDLAAGYGTLATQYGKVGVLAVFRVTAGVLILMALATAWLIGTIPYFLASLFCIVAPTVIIVRYLRGDPDVGVIHDATTRFGYVFALGLIPLMLMP